MVRTPDVFVSNTSASAADEAQARTALAAGRKSEALKLLDSAVGKRGAKIVSKKNRSALLAEPSSRARAHKLTTSGFNNDPVVASLNVALGRGPLADRASLAPAPITPPARPAAIATTTSAPPDTALIRSIQAELKSIDLEQRKQFSNERHARHAELTRRFRAEMKKFHVL